MLASRHRTEKVNPRPRPVEGYHRPPIQNDLPSQLQIVLGLSVFVRLPTFEFHILQRRRQVEGNQPRQMPTNDESFAGHGIQPDGPSRKVFLQRPVELPPIAPIPCYLRLLQPSRPNLRPHSFERRQR